VKAYRKVAIAVMKRCNWFCGRWTIRRWGFRDSDPQGQWMETPVIWLKHQKEKPRSTSRPRSHSVIQSSLIEFQ